MFDLDELTMAAIALVVAEIIGVLMAVDAVMQRRSSQGAVAWSVALVAMPVIAVPLYLVLGRTRFHGYAESLREAEAQARGADAVINVRFATSQITTGAAEFLAYGTAVKLAPPSS